MKQKDKNKMFTCESCKENGTKDYMVKHENKMYCESCFKGWYLECNREVSVYDFVPQLCKFNSSIH